MTDEELDAMVDGMMSEDPTARKVLNVWGFPVVTTPNLTPAEEKKLIDAVKKSMFKFGVRVDWAGWSRCLWLGVQVDLQRPRLSMVVFGIGFSVGYHLRDVSYNYCKDVGHEPEV